MARNLLQLLNGGKSGQLKKFLDDFKGEPRIAWYPSAGQDFRALMYLDSRYSDRHMASQPEPQSPDIFLFTDYFPWEYSTFLDRRTIYEDAHTTVYIEHIEELPRLGLSSLRQELVQRTQGSVATDRAVFMKIKVTSSYLGIITYPVIYAFGVNEDFYCEKIAPIQAKISHLIHVRYGGGLGGGGHASGSWLTNVLKPLGVEVFVTDDQNYEQDGDRFAMEICPAIPRESTSILTPIRVLPGHAWSDHGDITWYLVS